MDSIMIVHKKENKSILTLCTFSLCGRLFGVDIMDVKEVCSEIKISRIFHAPKSVEGYMNIRGQIHLVIDLRSVFNFEPMARSPDNRVIIFKSSVDEPFGVIVDGMNDVIKVDVEKIEERRKNETEHTGAKSNRKAAPDLTQGVCKLEKGLVVILNARGIIASSMGLNHINDKKEKN
jgi:purine-binding chemotaxis protein CheW